MGIIPKVYAHTHTSTEVKETSAMFMHNVPGKTVSGTLMVLAVVIAVAIMVWLFLKQRQYGKASVIQNLAWVFAVMFFGTTALTYIPGLTDEMGNFAGLFKLDLIDDLLHFGSAVWATLAAWYSTRQSVIYFKIFGALYALDGVVGLITQRGILDFGVWLYEYPDLSLWTNIGANLPHITIGGIALFAGFVLSRKIKH